MKQSFEAYKHWASLADIEGLFEAFCNLGGFRVGSGGTLRSLRRARGVIGFPNLIEGGIY